MNYDVSAAEGRVPVTILRLEGDLDASNYEDLIERGRELYDAGTRHLLIDMRAVPYMGSSGLVALHTIALTLEGAAPPETSDGWDAHHAIARSLEGGMQDQLKVLLPAAPGSSIARVFERTGMGRFIETYVDEAAAVASF